MLYVRSIVAETMEEVIGSLLVERGESLATAESLTGGGIAGRITSVSGASRYFRGAAVVWPRPPRTGPRSGASTTTAPLRKASRIGSPSRSVESTPLSTGQ